MGFFSKKEIFPAISLEGAVIVITGGGRGIGRATAEAFAAKGAKVCIGDLDLDLVTTTAEEAGASVIPFQVDVTDKDSFANFLQAVERRVGPIDILVNNAGVMAVGPFLEEPDAKSRAMIEVNLWGPIQGMRLVLPGMLARGRGHIVNVTSMAGKFPIPGAAVYAASKFGAVGLSMVVRDEVAHRGVSVSQVLPTAVRTELISGIPQGNGLPVVSPRTIARATGLNRIAKRSCPRTTTRPASLWTRQLNTSTPVEKTTNRFLLISAFRPITSLCRHRVNLWRNTADATTRAGGNCGKTAVPARSR